jgi:hypothetical protein
VKDVIRLQNSNLITSAFASPCGADKLSSMRMSTTWSRSGFRGVEQFRGRFRAAIGDHAWRSAYFDTAREAAEAYDREARKRCGRLGFYNFPRPGERRVELIDEDVCSRGHERARCTYYRPDVGGDLGIS